MYDKIIKTKRSNFFVVETVLALMILCAINLRFFPNKPAFAGIDPNPLWIVVLAIASRYGRAGAILSGFATSAYFVGYYALTLGLNAFYDDFWLFRFPFLFLLVGFLIGEIKSSFIIREDYLTHRDQELEKQNEKLKKEVDVLRESYKGISIEKATSNDTLIVLNDIISQLRSTTPQGVFDGILNSFNKHIGAEESSFYVLEGNVLDLVSKFGWKEYYRRPERFELGKGLVGKAAASMKECSIKDVVLNESIDDESSELMGDSVMAVPIFDRNNKLFGVASIEKIPLLKLTETTIQTAKIICELAAQSLNNIENITELKNKQIKDETTGLYHYSYLLSRINDEVKRSRAYKLPLSVIEFRWPGVTDRSTLDSATAIIRSSLREFDLLADGPDVDTPLMLLLPTTNKEESAKLMKKIADKIVDYGLAPLLTKEKIIDTITNTGLEDLDLNKFNKT